ncbi:serine hydrolase [Hymenobacter caeli]|uniref:CubicO group peptidase (Beta-lactamase class C family) n=1 Tax=Hymenobacter caeli TaxID=2735894 RepID=A0ABX2FTL6_9BACT|nr:serine hydrolase [Hymenobacter caeli]NRT20533.1 CubicO group peptidase (beta-lactamase class C family) [Hymenobacter caeli]
MLVRFMFCRGRLASLVALLLLAQPVAAQQYQPPGARFVRDSLTAYVRRGLRLWNIPGLAVVVVKNGQVVASQGFGVRAVDQPEPVDANTLFMIASNTKLFTGTALAQLEEERRLNLNDPVRKYLPSYRLYDSVSTRLVSVRDLLGHHLGTRTFQGDFTFWNSDLSRAEVVAKMRTLKPVNPFRQTYGYCNSSFLAAGEIIPAVLGGKKWEDWVQQRLLTPLGMANTYPLTAGYAQRPNIARPYSNAYGPLTPLPFDALDNLAPAAGLVSCANDLAHWLRFQLDSGRYNGQRVLPWATLQRTRQPNTAISDAKSSVLPSHFSVYGLGIYTGDYNGRQIFWHTGGAYGFVTNVCFVPEEGLGLAVLTNQDNQSFFEALRYQLLDAYLGVPYVDRSRQLYNLARAGREETRHGLADMAARVQHKDRPAHRLSTYAGTYRNPVYGTVTVEVQGKQLLVHFSHHPNLLATLDYMDDDQFRTTYSNPAYGILPAAFGAQAGGVRTLELRVNPFLEPEPYLFTKE